jgi:hypothetical protein
VFARGIIEMDITDSRREFETWFKNSLFADSKPYEKEALFDAWWSASAQDGGEPVAWDSPAVDPIVTRLYRKFKEWNQREFTADDVTWCEVRADVAEMLNATTRPLSAVVPEWVKCSERLTTERCLAYTPNNEDAVITLRIVPTRMLSHLSDVTHWMLLPEPPKQDPLN